MKSLLLSDYNHLEITDGPTPSIASNEVLIRVEACGICGSDVHGFYGSSGRRISPIVMSHEATGTITNGALRSPPRTVGFRSSNLFVGSRSQGELNTLGTQARVLCRQPCRSRLFSRSNPDGPCSPDKRKWVVPDQLRRAIE